MMSIVDEAYKEGFYSDGTSYLEWLESFTIDERVSDEQRLSYDKLIWRLWRIEYIPSFGNDDDRAIDGIELRKRYYKIVAEDTGLNEKVGDDRDVIDIYGQCRVLEMLIALSMHMYDLMQDMGVYNSVSRWFWEIMNRVGFDILDDEHWDEFGFDTKEYVNETCAHIMNRDGDYSRDGDCGGWFWIPGWTHMEVWYQMHAYLSQFFERSV